MPLTPESLFLHGTIAGLAAQYDEAGGGTPASRDSPTNGNGRQDRHGRGTDLAAPDLSAPVHATSPQTRNTVIESLGTYLPAEVVSTDTVLAGCTNEIGIPLERLTGIKSRRVAGPGEFSIDLARQAVD